MSSSTARPLRFLPPRDRLLRFPVDQTPLLPAPVVRWFEIGSERKPSDRIIDATSRTSRSPLSLEHPTGRTLSQRVRVLDHPLHARRDHHRVARLRSGELEATRRRRCAAARAVAREPTHSGVLEGGGAAVREGGARGRAGGVQGQAGVVTAPAVAGEEEEEASFDVGERPTDVLSRRPSGRASAFRQIRHATTYPYVRRWKEDARVDKK